MRGHGIDEDWSVEDLDVLLRVAVVNLDESLLCHQAGAAHAALASLAGALEALLLGMVVAHEDELRVTGLWPAQPSFLHLKELADLARQAGWLSEPVTGEVIDLLNKVRTVAAHPGAYVRAVRQVPELDLNDPAGFAVVYDIVVRASQALFASLLRILAADTTATSPQP